MRNVASLLEPILLHLAADKAKERHDALIRLKAILEGDSTGFRVETSQASRLVQSFVKMLRLELKSFLNGSQHDSEDDGPVKEMTTIQSNKIHQLMKDLKWMLGLLDGWFPSTNILQSLPDLYNFFLDALESSLTIIHCEVLILMKSFLFSKKAYLLEMRHDQWNRMMDILHSFIFSGGEGKSMSVALEGDIIGCLFFLTLAISDDVWTWSDHIADVCEMLAELLSINRRRNHESPSLTLLFRTVNYILNESKLRDPINYRQILDRVSPLMLAYPLFKTPSIIEEYYLFFLSNQIPRCNQLEMFATAESAKSRLKPVDLDYIKLGESIRAYNSRERSFVFSKGYLPFIIGLDFCDKYSSEQFDASLEACIKSSQSSHERLSLLLFKEHLSNSLNINVLLRLFESSMGPRQVFLTSLFVAKLSISKIESSVATKIFSSSTNMILKRTSIENSCLILSSLLRQHQDLVHAGPSFKQITESLSLNVLSEPCLSMLTLYFGLFFRGMWWSNNALDGYQLITETILASIENSTDSRLLLELLISNSHILAGLLSIPFTQNMKPSKILRLPNFVDSECLENLPKCDSRVYMTWSVNFEVRMEPYQLRGFLSLFEAFRSRLIEHIQIIGFQGCKILLHNTYQATVKEENFAIGLVQMFDINCLINSSLNHLADRTSIPFVLSSSDLAFIFKNVSALDSATKLPTVIKLLIQAFGFYKHKQASKQDFPISPNSASNLISIRPGSFFDHSVEKSNHYPFLFLKLLALLIEMVGKLDMVSFNQETVLFFEDFKLFVLDQFMNSLNESSVFLSLFAEFHSVLKDPIKDAAEILKGQLYRTDELAIAALVKILHCRLGTVREKSIEKIKLFVEPILNKYLKWKFKKETKLIVLNLIVDLASLGYIDEVIVWKALNDPSPYSVDLWPNQYSALLSLVSPNSLRVNFEEGKVWATSSCFGEALTKLKLLVMASQKCYVNLFPCLSAMIFEFPIQQLLVFCASNQPSAELTKLLPRNDLHKVGTLLLAQWIDRGFRLDSFPYPLFDTDMASLMASPLVFSQLVMVLGPDCAVEMCNPSKEFLSQSFSRLVGIALFKHFTGDTEITDKILCNLLKNRLDHGLFESYFKDNVIEILQVVIDLALNYDRVDIVYPCVAHIGTMFKYDSTLEMFCPAYMTYALFLSVENFILMPKHSLKVINFILSKSSGLLDNELVSDCLVSFLQKSIQLPYFQPSSIVLEVVKMLVKSSRVNFLISCILGKLIDKPALLSTWVHELLPVATLELQSVLKILSSDILTDSNFMNTDEMICGLLRNTPHEHLSLLVEKLYSTGCLQPQAISFLADMIKNGFYLSCPKAAEIRIFIFTHLTETHEARKVSPVGGGDIVTEVIFILNDLTKSSNIVETRSVINALIQLVNYESICGAGFWASLNPTLRSRFDFLKSLGIRKRVLVGKARRPRESLPEYGNLWLNTVIDNWSTTLLEVLSTLFSNNILWQKIGTVFKHENAAKSLLPLVFEDCFFSDPTNQATLLKPLGVFLNNFRPDFDFDILRLSVVVECIERIINKRKAGALKIEFDFQLLASIVSQLKLDHLKALYFFEFGLESFEYLSEASSEKLEQMYSAINATEYVGSFSAATRLGHITDQLDSLLIGDKLSKLQAEDDRLLWQLQKWDIQTIPDEFRLNQDVLDSFNILQSIALDEPAKTGLLLAEVCSRYDEAPMSLIRVLKAGDKFMRTKKISLQKKLPDQVDLCLLSMRPSQKSELCDYSSRILTRWRSEGNMIQLRNTLWQLENVSSFEGLEFVLKGEKAKLLWEKGATEAAVGLMKIALKSSPPPPIGDVFIREYVASSYSLIGEWILQTRSEKPTVIKENYLDAALKIIGNAPSNSDTLAYVYSTYAKFVDHMFDQMSRAENLELRGRLLKQGKSDLEALSKLAALNGRDEGVLRSVKEMEKQYQSDLKDYEETEKTRTSFLLLAVENYLRCLQLVDKHDFCVFRVCALWLQHHLRVPELSKLISSSVGRVPCHKFLPLIYQLAARAELSEMRSVESGTFQDTLERLLYRMALKHPYHCVYQILALKSGTITAKSSAPASKRKLVYSTETLEVRRAAAAGALISKLKSGDQRVGKLVDSIEMLCSAYIGLADVELPQDTKTNVQIKFDPRWRIGKLNHDLHPIPIPTKSLPIDASGQYTSVTTITGFGDGFKVVGGINLPKIIDCVGSDGQVYRQLVKGKDDVRQDAVMEQVFALVDLLLKSNEATRKKGLGIRTYRIIPLHALAGLLEWVSDTIPLGEYVLPAHERHHPDDFGVKAARNHMKAVWEDPTSTPARKLKTYQGICSRFRPVLRHFFWETSTSPVDWWERRSRYVVSCAATSMLGHVVGLGDRHCQNILLDKKTGELIQIDLNMIFELGKTLRVPERVPFRLTRDIVDGMGPAGTEGGFRKAAEDTMRLLRKEAETIVIILEVFKYDPLYRWNLNPIKQARKQAGEKDEPAPFRFNLSGDTSIAASSRRESELEDTSIVPPEADRALLRVREKLLGFEEGGGVQLSEAGQVRFLIQAATSAEALSQMYIGWQPWV